MFLYYQFKINNFSFPKDEEYEGDDSEEEDDEEDSEDMEAMRASQELALKFAESEDYLEVGAKLLILIPHTPACECSQILPSHKHHH